MSWDEYVKSCKEAVSQRQQQQQDVADPRALPVELLQTFRLPGPGIDSVSLLILNPGSHLPFNLAKIALADDTRAFSSRVAHE